MLWVLCNAPFNDCLAVNLAWNATGAAPCGSVGYASVTVIASWSPGLRRIVMCPGALEQGC